jgi:anoctamin-10
MALLNNIVEFRSDAFKLVTHFRRPLPNRTDTIGPWLNCLSFLSWLSALTNSALVFLFHNPHRATSSPADANDVARPPTCSVVSRALFIAFAASHGYIILRMAVRHLLERVMWAGCEEKARMDTTAREVRQQYLQSVSQRFGPLDTSEGQSSASPPPPSEFWEFDEGVDEIRKGIKDA